MCEADPSPFSPFSVLDGSPQPGGQWIRYNENFGFVSFAPTYSQTYNIATGTQPIIDTTYFVYILGTPPCAPGIDTVQVNYHPVINTGDLTVASVCVTDPPFILETLLTGTVTPGQTWTNAFPPNEVIPNLFDPSIYPPNTYLQLQYAGGLAGSLCYNATILQLTILPADANAGDPGTVNVCSTDASFNMEDFLLDDPEDGPPQSGGSWTTPSGTPTGSFFTPGISAPGVYTYSINSTCDSDQATLTVNVTNVPNPGTSGTLNICSNATNVPLISGLTGTPYTPGTWTGAPSGLVDGNNVTNGQVFTYTVGTPPCTATSTVTIALTPAPNAGVLTTTPQLYCATGAPVNLMSLFTTPPSTINAAYWSGPAGFTGGTLNPATATSGLYTYTIPNTGCGPASVSINITIEPQPNAGVDATVNACPNSVTPINLATSLGGGVTTGGAWTYGGAPSTGTFTPGVSLAGVYTYTVTSPLGACSDFANITVNYTVLPNPGTPQSINVCSNAAPFTLNSVNTGAAPGGVWTNPSGAVVLPIPATFNPATSPAGAYTYTIPVAGCASVTNVVTISITPLPNAGTSATSTQCSSFGSIDLTSLLGGTPTTGGTWYNGVTSIGNPYDISTLGGTTLNLQYVLGTAPCQSTSNLTLNVETPTTAGTGNPLAFCSNSAPFNLNTGLTGSINS